MTDEIASLVARRVWDSRGLPTVEIEIITHDGARGRGIAPAGASTGRREVAELRDGGERLGGKDVSHAVDLARSVVGPAIVGFDVADQQGIDEALSTLGASENEPVGGNTTTATSLAVLHAAAASRGIPAWATLNPTPQTIPRPQIQIIGGGAHAGHRTSVQDFMVMPISATRIQDAFLHVAEVYRAVGEIFAARAPRQGVADEGGYWPEVSGTEEALDILLSGIDRAGLVPGVDMGISLDIAASQFGGASGYRVNETGYTTEEWIGELARLCREYPILTLEDPAGEDDTDGMRLAVAMTGDRTVVVGDDYLVTDSKRIEGAARDRAVEAVLVKVNQVGTVSDAGRAVAAARANRLAVIVSARSGETEDVSVAHLAAGWGAEIVKVGSITRGERTAKWNQLIRIDDELGGLPLAPVVSMARLAT